MEYHKQSREWQSLFKKNWIQDYEIKFSAFSESILGKFHALEFASDKYWFRYTKTNRSGFLFDIIKAGKLNELKAIIQKTKEQIEEGLFSDFELEIDFELYTEQLAKLNTILSTLKAEEGSTEFKVRLDGLVGKIGIEKELDELEQDIKERFPRAFTVVTPADSAKNAKDEISLRARIERIYENIGQATKKTITGFKSVSDPVVELLPIQQKR